MLMHIAVVTQAANRNRVCIKQCDTQGICFKPILAGSQKWQNCQHYDLALKVMQESAAEQSRLNSIQEIVNCCCHLKGWTV
jgi:hypothetical protein